MNTLNRVLEPFRAAPHLIADSALAVGSFTAIFLIVMSL